MRFRSVDFSEAVRSRDNDGTRTAAQNHIDRALARIRRAVREVLPQDKSLGRGKTRVPRAG